MKRLTPFVSLLVSILLAVPLYASAQTATSTDALATLDAALEQPMVDVEIAVALLGSGLDNLPARDKLRGAANDALMALDAIGSRPCFAEFWDVAHMAYKLLARSVDLLDEADRATLALESESHDLAMEEFGFAATGYTLFGYSKLLRERTTCGPPVASPSPTPARTPTPERSVAP